MKRKLLADKYTGDTALGYESGRVDSEKWKIEQAVVQKLLEIFPRHTTVLDIPVGTGRFIEFYHRCNLDSTGMDISKDMLRVARDKAVSINYSMRFLEADIFDIKAEDEQYDVVVCMRFLNWVDSDGLRRILGELIRVSSCAIIVGIRHWIPASDLKPWRDFNGLVVFFRQIIFRVSNKKGLVIHNKGELGRLFGTLGVFVEEMCCVEKNNNGTEYYVYRLSIKKGLMI